MIKTIIKMLALALPVVLTGCGSGTPDSPALGAATSSVGGAQAQLNNPDKPTYRSSFRLLEQGTFGPMATDVSHVMQHGIEPWIDVQMQASPTLLLPAVVKRRSEDWNEYVNAWWLNMLYAQDQLRQRVAFALSEIFVVSAADGLGSEQFGLANYYDILVRNAFGNYRDLLDEITVSPIMGEYLSMKGNQKPDPEQNIRPDENFARELLQLFSIGLVHLNEDGSVVYNDNGLPRPTYDQSIIEGFAHVFTGWHFANADNFRWSSNKDYINPMQPWEDWHATGDKKLLRGYVLEGGKSAREDLAIALDNIFHHPNVGPFISKQLIQKLVTSNPTPTYVRDVARVFNSNENGERGNLGSVVKAILMHDEARFGHEQTPHTFGKLKEPVIRITTLWRAFMPNNIPVDFNYAWAQSDIGQAPLNSPSVFNFFTPNFSQPGDIQDHGLLSPEFQMLDEAAVISLTSRLLANSIWANNHQYDSDTYKMAIEISDEVTIEEQQGAEALLDHLDLVLTGGVMSDALRANARTLMEGYDYSSGGPQRVVEAIFLIISSPEAAVQR